MKFYKHLIFSKKVYKEYPTEIVSELLFKKIIKLKDEH